MKNKCSLYLSAFLTLAGAFLYSCSPYSAVDQNNFSKPVVSTDNTLHFQSELSLPNGTPIPKGTPYINLPIDPYETPEVAPNAYLKREEEANPRDGDIYIYNNPVTHRIEFFRSKVKYGDKQYLVFPTNGKDNPSWNYLGYINRKDAEPHEYSYDPTKDHIDKGPDYMNFHTFNENGEDIGFVSGAIYIYYDKKNDEVLFYKFTGLYENNRVLTFPNPNKDNGSWVHVDYKDPALISYIVSLLSPEAKAKLKPMSSVRVKRDNSSLPQKIMCFVKLLKDYRNYLKSLRGGVMQVSILHNNINPAWNTIHSYQDYLDFLDESVEGLEGHVAELELTFTRATYHSFWASAQVIIPNTLELIELQVSYPGYMAAYAIQAGGVNTSIHNFIQSLGNAYNLLPSTPTNFVQMTKFPTCGSCMTCDRPDRGPR